MANVNIALIHYPVYNKHKEIVTTCITGVDLHDLARTSLTYGVKRYFVVNPLPTQLAFARRIVDCWRKEESFSHNWTRAEAFRLIELGESLEQVIEKLKNPVLVATSARSGGRVSYRTFRQKLKKIRRPVLILFGTGWGLTEEILKKADYVLKPLKGRTAYNHLSVRSAVAIILDKLLGVH